MNEAMTWCDMTSSPTGEVVNINWRLADIMARYGPDSIVGEAIATAEPILRSETFRIDNALAGRTLGVQLGAPPPVPSWQGGYPPGSRWG